MKVHELWIEEAPFEVKFAEIRKDNSIISVFYSVTNFLFHLLGWNYCSSNISWVINILDLWNKFRIRPREALTKMSGYFRENVLCYTSIYCKVFSCKIDNLIRHLSRKKSLVFLVEHWKVFNITKLKQNFYACSLTILINSIVEKLKVLSFQKNS